MPAKKKAVAKKAPAARKSKKPALNARTGGLLGIELKYFDTSKLSFTAAQSTDATGGEADPTTILCLNGVPQGDTSSSRDGNIIGMKSLQVVGNVRVDKMLNQTAPKDIPSVYIAVVLDTQTNGAQLASEDVFQNPGASMFLAASPLRNMSYTSRFRVLGAQKVELAQPTMSWDGTNFEVNGQSQAFEFFIDLKGMKTRFQSGTTTGYVGTIVDNSIHVIAFQNSADYLAEVSYQARLRDEG